MLFLLNRSIQHQAYSLQNRAQSKADSTHFHIVEPYVKVKYIITRTIKKKKNAMNALKPASKFGRHTANCSGGAKTALLHR